MSSNNSARFPVSDIENLSIPTTIHRNLDQRVLVTTEDRLRLCVIEYARRSALNSEIWAPAGILVSILLTLVTAEFRDQWGLYPGFFSAIFVLSAVVSAIWLIKSMWHRKSAMTLDELIRAVREG